jgi:hypothetical protein
MHCISQGLDSNFRLTTIARLRHIQQTKIFWAMLKPYTETTRFPLPVSEDVPNFTIMLPLCPQMREAERYQLIGALQEAVRC